MRQKELKSTDWQRNLKIAWIGTFFTGASFSIVMPFMALYIEELGVKGDMVEWYAGLSVAISALASALVSPVWGRLADRYGRKPMMIRASMVMTFTMGGLALVPNVFWLLFLRTLNGLFAGYVPNATALIASQVPQNRSGYALGTLSTGLTAGVLIGPLLGGTLSEAFGMRGTFLLVGLILFICCLLTIFGLRENFQPVEKGEMMGLFHLIDGQLLPFHASLEIVEPFSSFCKNSQQIYVDWPFCDQYDYPDFCPIDCAYVGPLHSLFRSEGQYPFLLRVNSFCYGLL